MAADREEHDAHMRGAAMVAEHVYVEPDPESGERHVLLKGRRVGKIVWNAAEELWEEFHATPNGEYVLVGYSDVETDDPEWVDRRFVGDVASEVANGLHPMSEELR